MDGRMRRARRHVEVVRLVPRLDLAEDGPELLHAPPHAMPPVDPLDVDDVRRQGDLPRLVQQAHERRACEHLGGAEGNVARVVAAQVSQGVRNLRHEQLRAVLVAGSAVPHCLPELYGLRLRQDGAEPRHEVPEEHTRGEPGLPDAHGLEDARASELLEDHRRRELSGHLFLVGLDAPDEVWLRLGQGAHQGRERRPEARADGLDFPFAGRAGLLDLGIDRGADGSQHLVAGGHEQRGGLVGGPVDVLIHEAARSVEHLPSEVAHAELQTLRDLRRKEALVRREGAHDLGGEVLVAGLGDVHLFVQDRQDARLGIQQRYDVRVILVRQRGGGVDALSAVVIQLHPEDMVVEVRLQMLVAQIDEQLLQGVGLERLETGDVENPKELA
mmetsp:Transcript_118559/g.342828  ORF Transcript_118559/g.342828 Transcript_118559/m.342828 type:complete len:386 (-) Transcript_118559:1083-2240(-)